MGKGTVFSLFVSPQLDVGGGYPGLDGGSTPGLDGGGYHKSGWWGVP